MNAPSVAPLSITKPFVTEVIETAQVASSPSEVIEASPVASAPSVQPPAISDIKPPTILLANTNSNTLLWKDSMVQDGSVFFKNEGVSFKQKSDGGFVVSGRLASIDIDKWGNYSVKDALTGKIVGEGNIVESGGIFIDQGNGKFGNDVTKIVADVRFDKNNNISINSLTMVNSNPTVANNDVVYARIYSKDSGLAPPESELITNKPPVNRDEAPQGWSGMVDLVLGYTGLSNRAVATDLTALLRDLVKKQVSEWSKEDFMLAYALVSDPKASDRIADSDKALIQVLRPSLSKYQMGASTDPSKSDAVSFMVGMARMSLTDQAKASLLIASDRAGSDIAGVDEVRRLVSGSDHVVDQGYSAVNPNNVDESLKSLGFGSRVVAANAARALAQKDTSLWTNSDFILASIVTDSKSGLAGLVDAQTINQLSEKTNMNVGNGSGTVAKSGLTYSVNNGVTRVETPKYIITVSPDIHNSLIVVPKDGSGQFKIWGDPHVSANGQHIFDFWGTTSFSLDDGTKITIDTTQGKLGAVPTWLQAASITNGADGVLIKSKNVSEHISATNLEVVDFKGKGSALDMARGDGVGFSINWGSAGASVTPIGLTANNPLGQEWIKLYDLMLLLNR